MNVTRNDVKEAVEALGISLGDVVLVHSSMKSLGFVEGGPESVIQGFLDAIGSKGTLVMPTLSQKNFENAYRDWNMDRPSDVGLLTEVFRKFPEALRSDQATHSVAAVGALAREITEGHTAFGPRFGAFGDYAFSYSSPWQKMYDKHAKVVFIGVSMRYNTFKHFAEYCFVEKILRKIEGLPGGEELKDRVRHFSPDGISKEGIWPFLAGVRLHDAYIEAGLVKSAMCGEAELLSMPVHECVDFIISLLDKEPEKWVSEEVQAWLQDVEELASKHRENPQVFKLFYPWDKNGYCPDVRYELGVNETGFTMRITVPESDPRREMTQHFQNVCLDSCVEWFVNFMPQTCDRYFNFEVNANGIMNVSFRKDRYDSQYLTLEDIESLNIQTEIRDEYWEVCYTVPFTLIQKYIPGYAYHKGMVIRANFYKCGGMTEYVHHGVWNPLRLQRPDFHRPEYFGEILLD